jgi:hypothetical protein
MRPHLSQPFTRPKVSTMPRQKTEAAAYLDIYKLVNERKRLEQELAGMEQRRDRILQRLALIDQQTQVLEASAHALREASHQVAIPHAIASTAPSNPANIESYDLLYLEY